MSQLLQQDRYIIREKFWKFFGNTLWLRDEQGNLHGFCKAPRAYCNAARWPASSKNSG